MSDHAGLMTFIDTLRARGVKSYKGPFDVGTVELELGPPVLAEPKQDTTPDADLCKCGHHAAIEHNGSFCLSGCDIEKCHPPETP